MNIADVSGGERGLTVTWADRSVDEYPFIWLKDNDPGEFHTHTRERVFDLTSVKLDIRPDSFELDSTDLVVQWPTQTQASVYSFDWLRSHRPGIICHDPSVVDKLLWDGEILTEIPRADAGDCAASPPVLKEALLTLKRTGVIVIDGLEDEPRAGETFGDLIGFKRETNFGTMFEVRSKPDPNNLAYTAMALPLHTDLPNQLVVPGYQFLHSYRNDASGGESVFADGFRICADLERERPDEYELLKNVAIPWRFHDDQYDIRQHRPIISQYDNGEMACFAFNAHIADVPDMATDVLYDFYSAYQNLMLRMRKPKYSVRYSLSCGEMIAFDNHRILHGRSAFDAASGERHFRGYYIEQNEIDSRIRVLARQAEGNTAHL